MKTISGILHTPICDFWTKWGNHTFWFYSILPSFRLQFGEISVGFPILPMSEIFDSSPMSINFFLMPTTDHKMTFLYRKNVYLWSTIHLGCYDDHHFAQRSYWFVVLHCWKWHSQLKKNFNRFASRFFKSWRISGSNSETQCVRYGASSGQRW